MCHYLGCDTQVPSLERDESMRRYMSTRSAVASAERLITGIVIGQKFPTWPEKTAFSEPDWKYSGHRVWRRGPQVEAR